MRTAAEQEAEEGVRTAAELEAEEGVRTAAEQEADNTEFAITFYCKSTHSKA